MSTQVSRIFEFGPFRLNEAECQLFREGKQVPIPPKVFATLMLLIDNRGHLVSKDELMSQLWPDSFVEEVSLNRSISTLRKALGDTTTAPLYVETVPKRGYRFIAPVIEATGCDELIVERWSSAEIITEEVEETLSPHSRQRLDVSSTTEEAHITVPAPAISTVPKRDTDTRRRFLFAAVVLAALVAAASSYFWTNNRNARVPVTAPVKSIAVLPFGVVGAESGDAHIGVGLADVLITRLSNIRELNVRPTSAVMNLDGRDSASAGLKLQVDAVLEGTIYRAGDRVRVTARLLKVSDQSPLWAGQFERPAQDELKLQDEIALQVVDALALSLTGDEKTALTKRYTESADAYQLYLKGRYHWNKRSNEGLAEAERLFRNAIDKDPNFALAYVGLVDKLAMGQPLSMTVATDEKTQALEKALELDPNLAEAHASLGLVRMFQYWDWRGAEAAFKRSIELNPGYASAHQWYATLLGIQGRTDEAKAEMRRALEINPLSHNFLRDMGEAHYFAREYERAEEYCHKALEIYPDFIYAHHLLEHIRMQRAEYDEYIEQQIKTSRLVHASAHQTAKDKENLEKDLAEQREHFKKLGIKDFIAKTLFRQPMSSDANVWARAWNYAHFGEKEKALDNLEEAYRRRVFMLAFVKADPVFDNLRTEPRFTELLKKMNLAE